MFPESFGATGRRTILQTALLIGSAAEFTPYEPAPGWQYHLEAYHPADPWPACEARFLSFPGSCDSVDLGSGAGDNQQFEL